MFVKITKGDGRWLSLLDVRSIDHPSVAKTASSGTELQHELDEIRSRVNGCEIKSALMDIDWQNPPRSIRPERPYCFNYITVEHGDRTKTCVLFDHPVYLCDDSGKTVDKINVSPSPTDRQIDR